MLRQSTLRKTSYCTLKSSSIQSGLAALENEWSNTGSDSKVTSQQKIPGNQKRKPGGLHQDRFCKHIESSTMPTQERWQTHRLWRQSPGTKLGLAIPFPLNRFVHGFVLQRGLPDELLWQVVFNGSNPRSRILSAP